MGFEIDQTKAVFARRKNDDIILEDRNQKIREMHEAGKSNKEIAERSSLSNGRVSQIIRNIGGEEKPDDEQARSTTATDRKR